MLFNVISGSLKGPNNYNSSLSKKPVSFGCRMVAFVPPSNMTTEDDVFMHNLLVTGKDSLKNLSNRTEPMQDGFNRPYDYETLSGTYYKNTENNPRSGHPHGWGICTYNKNNMTPSVVKRPISAFNDPFYDVAAKLAVQRNPSILLAHIRRTAFKSIVTENNHPFTYKNWSFMHNGNAIGVTSPQILNKLNNEYCKALGVEIKGNTHSEKAFYYFLGELFKTYNTVNTDKIPKEGIVNVFAKSIQDIINHSKPYSEKISNNYLGLSGQIQTGPACTFIASDGKMLLAFKNGKNLYLGMKVFHGNKKEYVVSSEPVQPYQNRQDIQWMEIPENHIIVISKDAYGNALPELVPLSNFNKSK